MSLNAIADPGRRTLEHANGTDLSLRELSPESRKEGGDMLVSAIDLLGKANSSTTYHQRTDTNRLESARILYKGALRTFFSTESVNDVTARCSFLDFQRLYGGTGEDARHYRREARGALERFIKGLSDSVPELGFDPSNTVYACSHIDSQFSPSWGEISTQIGRHSSEDGNARRLEAMLAQLPAEGPEVDASRLVVQGNIGALYHMVYKAKNSIKKEPPFELTAKCVRTICDDIVPRYVDATLSEDLRHVTACVEQLNGDVVSTLFSPSEKLALAMFERLFSYMDNVRNVVNSPTKTLGGVGITNSRS